MEIKSEIKCFEGSLIRFTHPSLSTHTTMTVSVYIPSTSSATLESVETFPTLLYLSGLTCTDENVCMKGGPLFKTLSELRMGFIAPDTSPRGANVPGEADSWDFGVGAGFYVDAIKEPWSSHYNMYSYVTKELLDIVATHFPALNLNKLAISGHSMGGHGALTLGLRNLHLFRSISAFSPICHPSVSPWGIKAFTGYLGEDRTLWKRYDATEIMLDEHSPQPLVSTILIDVGTKDPFLLAGQLLPQVK